MLIYFSKLRFLKFAFDQPQLKIRISGQELGSYPLTEPRIRVQIGRSLY